VCKEKQRRQDNLKSLSRGLPAAARRTAALPPFSLNLIIFFLLPLVGGLCFCGFVFFGFLVGLFCFFGWFFLFFFCVGWVCFWCGFWILLPLPLRRPGSNQKHPGAAHVTASFYGCSAWLGLCCASGGGETASCQEPHQSLWTADPAG